MVEIYVIVSRDTFPAVISERYLLIKMKEEIHYILPKGLNSTYFKIKQRIKLVTKLRHLSCK